MPQDINLLNAIYSGVPAVVLPKNGGGTATFTDVTDTTATAADVASGKYFYTAAGVRTAGTSSGGGGGGPTLLVTQALGEVVQTATAATSLGITVTVPNATSYDMLLVETSVDEIVKSRHVASMRPVYVTASLTVANKNATNYAGGCWCAKADANTPPRISTRYNSTAYGVYPNAASISGTDVNLVMYARYNSTYAGTINNTYTTRVYGISLYDLIGG